MDIPLYLENKMYEKNDVIIFLKTRRKDVDIRLRNRKNFNQKILNILRKSQLNLRQKQLKSDYLLVNKFSSLIMKRRLKYLSKDIK